LESLAVALHPLQRRPRRNNLFERVTSDSELSEREKVRDREDAIASTRDACAPQNTRVKLQGNALLKLASDGFGLLRYVQSGGRLREFISRNTASTRARLGENSQIGSVFAAFPVSNAA
jgi:hypothetical protein